MVHDLVPLARGEWIVQNAANSSCGRFVIRLARRAGLRTVSVVRRAAAVEELTGLGGDLVLEDGPDLHARVAAATDGAAIRLALDAVGGPATQRLAECLADGGTVATYGAMGGARCEIDFYLMFRQDIRLVGVSFVRELMRRRSREEIRAIYADLAAQLARGELVARIAATYPLDRVVEACEHAALTGEERDGKVILDLAST
jgi:NADPH:quinone reductase-like Zn-dependent oxidoreductase